MGLSSVSKPLWPRWFWDGLVLAYFLSGGPVFDPRLECLPGFSLNQLLGVLTMARLSWLLLRGPRRHPRALVTFLAVSVLTAFLALRGLGSPNPEYARFKILGYALLVLPVLAYFDWSVRERQDFLRLLNLWGLSAVALVILAIPSLLRIGEGQRLAVLAGGPNVFARVVGCGVLCLLLLALHRRHSWRDPKAWVLALYLPWAVVALLLSGSKAVLGSLFLAASAALLSWGTRRIAVAILLLLLVAAVTPLWTHRLIQDRPKDGGLVRLLRLPDVNDPQGSFGSRLGYIESTWETLKGSPWFGVGTGAWGVRTGRGFGEKYPHHMGMEMVAELGLMGLLLTGLPLLAWPRRPSWSNRQDRLLSAGLLGVLVFWVVNVQLSGDLVDSRYLWLFLLLFEAHWRLDTEQRSGRAGPFRNGLPVWKRDRRPLAHEPLLESRRLFRRPR